MSKTVQEIMEVMGKTVEASVALERKNGSSYTHIADINPEDINEARYYFDGALYRSVMRCLELKLKNNWTTKAKKGLLLDGFNIKVTHPEGDSVTIGYGGFYIAEEPEYDAAQNLTSIIAYDELYPSMQAYDMSLDWTNGISLKNYLIAILNKLGINYDVQSLNLMANADKVITSEKFLDIENDSTESAYTYRDVLDEIAKAAGVTFAFRNSLRGDEYKLYAIKPTESGYVIDESNLRSVTIGAKYGPVMGVVLSREPQEDNVFYPSNLTDSQTAVKISNVEIMEDSGNDAYRETFIQGIYNNVKNTEYYLYDLDSFGIGFLNFGDIFTLKVCERKNGEIGDEKEYKTIFMRTDMTVGDGIKEKSKLEAPQATSTDYAAASTTDKALKKTMLKVDKQEQRITALVKETDEKYSKLTQTVDGFEIEIADTKNGLEAKIIATAKSFEATYAKKETVAGQIKGITDQLEGIDGKIEGKVTTEVQKDTTIEILAGKVNSKISGNYVTKTDYDDEKKNWVLLTDYNSRLEQTDQNITASVNRIQTLENAGYITQDTAESLISAQEGNITLSVEKNLKIGARNILLDSACFAGLPVAGRTSTIPTITLYDDTAVPSGAFKDIVFSPLSTNLNADGTCANPRGFYFTSSSLIGQIYSEAVYMLTSDTEVNEYKRYYTRSGSEGSYVYSYVESPTKDDLATYYELTQEAQRIDKIKPNTTYALSWWMRWGYSLDKPNDFQFNDVLYFGAYNYAKYNSDKCVFPGLSTAWQRYVIVFTTPAKITDFWLRFFFASVSPEIKYSVHISSLKLEEGNIATDWTPSAEDIDQSVKAQIDLCVKTDENGKLVSEILIESNKLRINTDNFKLDGNGNMACVNAEMSNVTISGVVTANNAVLGGWHIADNELYSECGSCTAHIKAPQSSSEYFFAVRESLGDNKYTSNFAINTDGSVFMNNLVAAETGITIKTYSSKEKKYVENIKICGTIQSYPTSNCYYDTIMANHDLCIETGYDKIMRLYANKIYLCNRVILTEYQSGTKGKAALYVDTNTGEITVESS